MTGSVEMYYSKMAMYEPNYFKANRDAILASSSCGIPSELLQIDNYSYWCVKSTEYGDKSRDYDSKSLITDLEDMRAGNFDRLAMTVADFHAVKKSKKTAGDSNDYVRFERFTDPVYGGRWRLILSNRDSLNAFSIKVYNNDGGYLYTPGAFIDQGDGTWMVESSYTEYDGGDVNIDFISGSASITEVYHAKKDTDVYEWDITYFKDVAIEVHPKKKMVQ